MAINKKLIHFKTRKNFDTEFTNGNILDTSICFIKDTQEIWTHGLFYPCLTGRIPIIFTVTVTEAGNWAGGKLNPLSFSSDIDPRPRVGDIIDGYGVITSVDSSNIYSSLKRYVHKFNSKYEYKNYYLIDSLNLDEKVDKVEGKQLSTNDYTTAEKNKLAGITEGAQPNVQSDWNATSGDAFIKNKPTIPTKTSQLTNDSSYQTDKLVSAAISTAIANKAESADIPTKVSLLTNDSNYQTDTQVNTAILKVVGAAPEALDTLEEIAAKLSDNDDVVAGIVNTLGTKADKSVVTTTSDGLMSKGDKINLNKIANDYVTRTTELTITGAKTFDRGINCIHPNTTSSTAMGVSFLDYDNTRKSAVGTLLSNHVLNHAYVGWGTEPWNEVNCLAVSDSKLRYKGLDIIHKNNAYTLLSDTFSLGSNIQYKTPESRTAGWIRIAKIVGTTGLGYGIIGIGHTYSNNITQGVIFSISPAYKENTSGIITLLGGSNSTFPKARLVYPTNSIDNINAEVYIEVYYNATKYNYLNISSAGAFSIALYGAFTEGSIPTGYAAKEFTFTRGISSDIIKGNQIVKEGGTANQILMADGSVQNLYKADEITTATTDAGTITPYAMNKWVSANFAKGLHAEYKVTGTAAGRWVRIAQITHTSGYGIISINNTYWDNNPSGITFTVTASHGFNPASMSITQIGGNNSLIHKARIVYEPSTSNIQYLEVYYKTSSINNSFFIDLCNSYGCLLYPSYTEGSVPDKYRAIEYPFTNGISAKGVRACLIGASESSDINPDDAYGIINVTRNNKDENLSYYGLVRTSKYSRGIGLNLDGNFILGGAAATNGKTIHPWIIISGSSTLVPALTIESGTDNKLILNSTDGESYSLISFREKGTQYATIAASSSAINLTGKPVNISLGLNVKGTGITSETASFCSISMNSSGDETYILTKNKGTSKTASGWKSGEGSYLYNYPSAKYLGIKDDGTPHFSGNKLWHAGNDGSGSGLDADTVDGVLAANLMYSLGINNISVGSNGAEITTALFIEKLKTLKAFDYLAWNMKVHWYYAGNDIITDTGCGDIHLAGALIEKYGNSVNFTIRVTTATEAATGGTPNAVFIYRQLSTETIYKKGWTRLLHSAESINAASATKLTTNAGDATQPVYFSGGKPVACTYTLGKSVPSNAVFTDTTYSTASLSALGLMSAADKKKLDGIAAGANAYSLPTASASTLGGIKVGTNLSISNGVLSATNTTYGVATASANGLMSAADKTKLNTITGSQAITLAASTVIPKNTRLVVVNRGSVTSYTLNVTTLAAGEELHIIFKSSTSNLVVAIPTAKFISDTDTLEIKSGKTGEINIVSDGTSMYVKTA